MLSNVQGSRGERSAPLQFDEEFAKLSSKRPDILSLILYLSLSKQNRRKMQGRLLANLKNEPFTFAGIVDMHPIHICALKGSQSGLRLVLSKWPQSVHALTQVGECLPLAPARSCGGTPANT
jgi:hypothetical protein